MATPPPYTVEGILNSLYYLQKVPEQYDIHTIHKAHIKETFEKVEGATKYTIKEKPSRDNIDFITPPVTFYTGSSNRTKDYINSAFRKFSERFCSKFYIPDDVSMCLSLLFNGMNRYGNIGIRISELVYKIAMYHSLCVSKNNPYTIPPSLYFLHALNAINYNNITTLDFHPETFKEVGTRVSASILRYSLFELGDVYLRILIKSLNREEASPSLLLDAPPDLVPLTECHARVLAARVKRMGILPKDGTMSTAIYRLYFDTIEGCINDFRPIPFDPDMVYSGCVFELKHLVRQGKIIMRRKKKLLEKDEDAPSSKRRCVISTEEGRITIVKRDSSSLVPLESDGEELAFLNKNEIALARLLKRLETSGYCSFIDVEDAPGTGGAEEALVAFFKPLLEDNLYVFSEYMSVDGFDTAVRRLEKNKQEKLLSDIRKRGKNFQPLHRCEEIHPESTLMPAIELSLGKDFPFEATVLSIFNRLSTLANADGPAHNDVIDEFSPAGYTALTKTFITVRASVSNGEEIELKVLKELVDTADKFSWNKKSTHSRSIVCRLLDEGYEYKYPEANKDALFSYVLDKLYKFFAEKGRMRSFDEINLFDKVSPFVYESCVEQYLKKRAFAADSINVAIDAMCYVKSGYRALIWIVKNAFPNNEDARKTAFMRMIRNTVTQTFLYSPEEKEGPPPLPSISLETLVVVFPDMCYMADKDFGVLRECIERESLAFYGILKLLNVRATINCRYRHYGNAPAICLGHLMADTIRHNEFVRAFLQIGADPLITTNEGENVLHFMARTWPLLPNKTRPLDSFVTTENPNQELGMEKTKLLFETRRKFDGATPVMVAVAHRNFCALTNFKKHFPLYDDSLAFTTAFGRSDCLRTVDVMVLAGAFYPNILNLGDVTTARPSIRLLAKAALEGKLYYNGDSPVPLNRVGLTFDECAYRGVRNIKHAICHSSCACKFISDSKFNNNEKKVPSFEHKDDIWCGLNCASNATVDQIFTKRCITYWRSFKKEYVRLCAAIANNDKEILGKMIRIHEMRRGNLTYSDGNCAICLEELNETTGKLYYIEECDHVYHKQCIMTWEQENSEQENNRCPMCNVEYENSVSTIDDDDVITQG